MLPLGWAGVNSFIPVSYNPFSATEDKNLLCGVGHCDDRSLAERRHRQSQRKVTNGMAELIHSIQCTDILAGYVLFDS